MNWTQKQHFYISANIVKISFTIQDPQFSLFEQSFNESQVSSVLNIANVSPKFKF